MLFKRNRFTVDEMIEMENELKNSELFSKNLKANDESLADKLRLKVEYVTDMDEDNEAELLPIDDDNYNGLIRVHKDLEKSKFAYIHEIIHYIFDVGFGKKVAKNFTRKRKGKTDSNNEQKINYKAAAYIMPCNEILKYLQDYDNSVPKKDELNFVRKLQEIYGQSKVTVIRRIHEVRKLHKANYC